jgi:hypothetical protein
MATKEDNQSSIEVVHVEISNNWIVIISENYVRKEVVTKSYKTQKKTYPILSFVQVVKDCSKD